MSCEDRVRKEYRERMREVQEVWGAHLGEDSEEYGEDDIFDFGLGFDYVGPNTFSDQPLGYWRWQLSTGGPADEFRFYVQPTRFSYSPWGIEYWFLDWYDGACKSLSGDDYDLLAEIFDWFAGGIDMETQMRDY